MVGHPLGFPFNLQSKRVPSNKTDPYEAGVIKCNDFLPHKHSACGRVPGRSRRSDRKARGSNPQTTTPNHQLGDV